ncbi:putative bifunctional diguanylate cyclase/phosphodiesterase [Celeribacter indicus]|uniref:EAL domain-containing protein n=1 Tax=Celeribacter indicus TaxID=1208324 RepID=A0A0B5DQN5_9RHOB|nr:bifunctional diguanylate cyclase/phosphodiesterase [Celeribacter indicus]AJE45409.1 EAL domain-containing protein [Celeribacter indicus]SDX01234.1 diguanylate cyclase/phosphodiesterase [Celeribacter indicus]
MRRDIAETLQRLRDALTGPQSLTFLPAICLGAYWFGGEAALLLVALGLPALLAAARILLSRRERGSVTATDGLTGLALRPAVPRALDQMLEAREASGRSTACLVIEIDEFRATRTLLGETASDAVLRTAARRLRDVLREADLIARIDTARFAIVPAPMRRTDLETLIQLAARLQAALGAPYSVDASKVHVTCSVGFCLPSRAPAMSGQAFLEAAEAALAEARHHGAGSIRAFTAARGTGPLDPGTVLAEAGDALENGQIVPWFQPQISTDTGEVSGMEALARWTHPERGVLSPEQFLFALDDLGLRDRLGELILYHALTALTIWDKAGLCVPGISVNFSAEDLANPKLVDKIRWELDRFELSPERLTIEILESVISTAEDDMVTRNIRALRELGCGIELDDYGTGHASLSNIRRFAVDRIKIDRSYVTRCDLDRDQQNMLAAILTMAERLDLQTVAEGVETVGEHAMLSQLGCGHVQGFSISRPLPFDKTLDWMEAHRRKLSQTPRIGRHAG